MLTVNHTGIDHVQSIYSIVKAEYNPLDGSCREGHEACNGRVFVEIEDGTIIPLYEGSVFVMNAEGKTVAKYDLGGWENTPPENIAA